MVVEAAGEPELDAAMGGRAGVIVDVIFGTGLNAEVKGLARRAIEAINHAGAPVLAVDIASGVNSDSGAVNGAVVRAALTVTFGFARFGHVSYPGAESCVARPKSRRLDSHQPRSARSRRAASFSTRPRRGHICVRVHATRTRATTAT